MRFEVLPRSGWSVEAPQGRYVWLTPHGLGFLVDHRGIGPISEKHARMILEATPGVDPYPGVRLELTGDGAGPD